MIVDGSLPAGVCINEVHVSQRLGVSRTCLIARDSRRAEVMRK